MRPEFEDWERKNMMRDERSIYKGSPEIEMSITLIDPSIEKQRLIEEMFLDTFNKAQEIMEQGE